MAARLLLRPEARRAILPPPPGDGPAAFHRRLPGYQPTPIVPLERLARDLGVREIVAKVEADRLGLPAFKILGASWATYRTLAARLGRDPEDWRAVEDLSAAFAPLRPLTLVTATDGNHGRAVARVARWLGLDARIFVPQGTVRARIDAIAGEGAEVVVVEGDYDEAVRQAARDAGPRRRIVSDTSWPGYTEIPRFVIDGYRTIFEEVDAGGYGPPDLVLIPGGVGALAAAAAIHYRRAGRRSRPALVCVEPLSAACLLASAQARALTSAPGPHRSIMAGLNCGTPSLVAWPFVEAAFDAYLAIADERAVEAMRALAAEGIRAGESGAAATAGLIELRRGSVAKEAGRALGLGSGTVALVLVTEGPTDPESYARMVPG